jgi:DNA invertase Pin-like site-specific DNA recombinase
MATGKFISYLRVSTDKQGKSGLGLEAQRDAVTSFLDGGRWTLIAEYQEIESGKKDDRERPQLAKALHHCKVTGATLVIAKLDRLARDAHFLLGLQKAGVRFVAADMPEANEMVVGIMAVIAQGERKMISERTKAALAAAKARGVKLGNPNGAAHLRGLGNAKAVEAIKANAQRRAMDVLGTIEDLRASGVTSARQLAKALNDRGILTPRGGRWHTASVQRVLGRADATGRAE